MKRLVPPAIGAAALAIALVVSTAGAASHKPVKLEFWSPYSSKREIANYQAAFKGFQTKYPWITVHGVGNIKDEKLTAAIHAGNAPDAVLSFSPNNVGTFCSTGAFQSLNDRIKKDKLDLSQFPKATTAYTGYQGNQCALPALADATGLYFNRTQFKKAGIAGPPKTLSELFADAKKLTVKNADGSLKVVGINPFMGHYEPFSDALRIAYGAPWFDASGKPVLGKDPRWTALVTWQKKLVDFYGYDNLVKFNAASQDEFGPQNDFEVGRVAMQYDGEWRTAFIADEAKTLKYGTAPFPAADSAPGQYGAASVGGNIVGIPKGSKHPDEAWLLIKFLATDTDSLVAQSLSLHNLPTTKASLAKTAKAGADPRFAVFFKIFNNPKSEFNPITPIGQQYGDDLTSFFTKWQAGTIKDAAKGLADVDKQIVGQLAQAGGSGAP